MQSMNSPGSQEIQHSDNQVNHTSEGEPVNRLCAEFRRTTGPAHFLDVGAKLGGYSIPVALCLQEIGHGGKVIAMEESPAIAQELKSSVVANALEGTIDVYNSELG